MPLFIGLPYIFIEAFTFWLVSRWIGVGPALLWLIGLLFLGVIVGAWQMSSIARKAGTQRGGLGKTAGDLGLTAAGAILMALPGFVTSFFGLLLMLPPTRALLRGVLAKKLRTRIEEVGMKSFEMTNHYRQQTSYGTFGQASDGSTGRPRTSNDDPLVIDEDEIQNWTNNVRPEDFGPKDNK